MRSGAHHFWKRVSYRISFILLLCLTSIRIYPQPRTPPPLEGRQFAETSHRGACRDYREPAIAQVAKFLAKKPLSPCSGLFEAAHSEWYLSVGVPLERQWQAKVTDYQNLLAWWEPHYRKMAPQRVFYPFAGPDISNPLVLFPRSRIYTLFGLEETGPRPSIKSYRKLIKTQKMRGKLSSLQQALGSLLGLNFFKTRQMQKDFARHSQISLVEVLLFFLVKHGATVLSFYQSGIDRTGKVVVGRKSLQMKTRGVSIVFLMPGFKKKKILRYFQLNARSPVFLAQHSSFAQYLGTQKRKSITLIKAASYLLHRRAGDPFRDVRRLILETSGLILQDPSGIPLSIFNDMGWKVDAYGIYSGPIPLFRSFLQRDLVVRTRKNEALNFSWGYKGGRLPQNSSIMIAAPPSTLD